jgi:hypothetical protein
VCPTFIVARWGVEEGEGGEGGHTVAGGGGWGPGTALSGRPWSGASGHMPDRKQGRTGSLMCGPGSHSVGQHQIRFEIEFQMNSNQIQIKFKSFQTLTGLKRTLPCSKNLK